MRSTCLRVLIGCALMGVPCAAHADVVTDWNTAALESIRAERTPPPIASRVLAILHASMYDAVNGISRINEPYFVQSAVPWVRRRKRPPRPRRGAC